MVLKLQLCLVATLLSILVTFPVMSSLYRRDIRLFGRPDLMQKTLERLLGQMWDLVWRRRRSQEVISQWPTFLEELAVTVMAGIDARRAFEICSLKTHGYLKQISERTVLKLQSGASLAVALESMEKEGIEPARRLRATLVQAESLGTPVADALNALSQEYYILEQQMFETRLNALPLKLSIITVLFLLPPILIISIAPHILAFFNAGW
ncbi:MAG: type II secretion system F family protein [Firmicutes bacterium]|nr:type II secretion system F family protein [Candidatus Fermentithermobacillaceae bacterium]